MSTDLRTRIERELEDLAPLPDLVPTVVARGRRRLLLRRGSVTVAAVAAGTVGVVMGAGLLAQAPTPPLTQAPAASGPRVATSIDTRAEFNDHAAGVFSQILPERFGDVTVVGHQPGPFRFGSAATVVHFNYGGADVSSEVFCSAYDQADSCRQTRIDQVLAVAAHQADDSGWQQASLTLSYRGATLSMNLFSADPAVPVPISDAELLAMAGTPEFQRLWDEFADHPEWLGESSVLHVDKNGEVVMN